MTVEDGPTWGNGLDSASVGGVGDVDSTVTVGRRGMDWDSGKQV